MFRISFNSLLFVGLFFSTALGFTRVLDSIDPHPFPGMIQAKFDYFARHKNEFDGVFIGSSHIAMQIDPLTFDAKMKALQRPVKSFNFGIDGLTLYEVDRIIEEITKLKPARLRWCVIDASGWGHVTDPKHKSAYTERGIWWHTPQHTAQAIQSVMIRAIPAIDKFRLVNTHLAHMSLKVLPIGRAITWHDDPRKRTAHGKKGIAVHMGFTPMRISMVRYNTARLKSEKFYNIHFRSHEDYVTNLVGDDIEDRAINAVLIYDVAQDRKQRFAEFERKAYGNLSAHALQWGVEPIYLVPPRLYLYDRYKPSPVMDFSDPKEYPELFSVRNRSDPGHLTAQAAREYSEIVAQRFVSVTAGARKAIGE